MWKGVELAVAGWLVHDLAVGRSLREVGALPSPTSYSYIHVGQNGAASSVAPHHPL